MCGIVGFFNKETFADVTMLHKMINKLTHRGPNSQGCFFETKHDHQIGLGHTRLAILDTSSLGNQPMIFGDWVIIYNGEIYNFSAIKKELQIEGYQFTSNTDTEVIVKAFDKWGPSSISHFRGMFAFCIYNKSLGRAYLVRDRVGVKPLYYYHHKGVLAFTSEIKGLEPYHPFRKELDLDGMGSYFQYGYIKAPSTIYKYLYKVPPGHYLEFDLVKCQLSHHQYWDLTTFYQLPKLKLQEEEAVSHLTFLLNESFNLRMVADVPVGVFLSGGIDSSLVASILQASAAKPISTFTIGFEDNYYNEANYARQIANYLGTNHHEHFCTQKHAEALIYKIPEIYDEPFADSSCIPASLVSLFAKQHVSVALSGDGGDELFCGYDTYTLNNKRFEQLFRIPGIDVISKLINFLPDPLMPLFKLHFDNYNRYLKLKSVFASKTLEQKYDAVVRTFTALELRKYFKTMLTNSDLSAINYNILDKIETMMLHDFKYYLPDNLLVKVDRATMHYSLEGREPLLDHKLLEFAAQLPMHFKYNKKILKKILSNYLPVNYFERKKHGFGIPVNHWLKADLKFLLQRYFDRAKLERQGIFNSSYITKLSKAFLRSASNDNRIWTLLIFQMWYEKNFNEEF